MRKDSAIHLFVMRAMDEGRSGEELCARVAKLLDRKVAPPHTLAIAKAIGIARDAVGRKPCDGTKVSKAYRLILAGASNEAVAEALRSSVKMAGDWRKQLCWVAPQAAASPRARAKASINWETRTTSPPLRRAKRAIWEYVVDMVESGFDNMDDITLLVREHVDPTASKTIVRNVYSTLVMAKIALEGHKDETQWNRVAQAIIAGRGNREAAYECDAPRDVVAGVRVALRWIDAARIPVDPTSHLQPSQSSTPKASPPLGAGVPWAPPGPKRELIAEGRGVGVRRAAEQLLLSGRTNEDALAELQRRFPESTATLLDMRTYRAALRRKFGPDTLPTDTALRRERGLPSTRKEAWARKHPPKIKPVAGPPKRRSAPIGDMAKDAILQNLTDAEVLARIQGAFPGAATTLDSINQYRSALRRELGSGAVPSNLEVRRSRGLPVRQRAPRLVAAE